MPAANCPINKQENMQELQFINFTSTVCIISQEDRRNKYSLSNAFYFKNGPAQDVGIRRKYNVVPTSTQKFAVYAGNKPV